MNTCKKSACILRIRSRRTKAKKSEEVEVYRRIRLSSNSTSDTSYGEIIYSTASLGIPYTPQLAQWVEMRRTKSPWEAQSNWVKWSRHLKRWGNNGSWDEVMVVGIGIGRWAGDHWWQLLHVNVLISKFTWYFDDYFASNVPDTLTRPQNSIQNSPTTAACR